MFEFEIIPDDPAKERFRVEAGMRDLRMWEKTHRGRGLGLLSDKASVSATILFEIAYSAARRQGKLPSGLTSDQFAEQYDLDLLDDEPVEAPPAPADPVDADEPPADEPPAWPGFTPLGASAER